MKAVAKGSFTVKMTPHPWHESNGGESAVDHSLARFTLDKQYQGDLEATGDGQMLSAGSPSTSAVYVAIEKVTGSLQGRKGSFVLYHTGIMNRGVPTLTITVAPDSGTGDLTGLSGSLTIQIADGKHSYEFAYSLATIQ
jgi:hypothetical protein